MLWGTMFVLCSAPNNNYSWKWMTVHFHHNSIQLKHLDYAVLLIDICSIGWNSSFSYVWKSSLATHCILVWFAWVFCASEAESTDSYNPGCICKVSWNSFFNVVHLGTITGLVLRSLFLHACMLCFYLGKGEVLLPH